MQFIKKIIRPSKKNNEDQVAPNLSFYFDEMLELDDAPFTNAIDELKALEETCESSESYLEYLLEDTVFVSLHLTFYEKLITVLGKHPELALKMMDKFSEDTEEREFTISKETFCHVKYIENQGICHGCEAHENHHDVNSLIQYYTEGDLDFFIRLYLGMKTIQFTFDKLLYDILPEGPSLFTGQNEESILTLRKYIFSYVTQQLQ